LLKLLLLRLLWLLRPLWQILRLLLWRLHRVLGQMQLWLQLPRLQGLLWQILRLLQLWRLHRVLGHMQLWLRRLQRLLRLMLRLLQLWRLRRALRQMQLWLLQPRRLQRLLRLWLLHQLLRLLLLMHLRWKLLVHLHLRRKRFRAINATFGRAPNYFWLDLNMLCVRMSWLLSYLLDLLINFL